MKKLAYATAALFVLLVGAILVGPSFIDWNQYKAEITAQAFDVTGRELIVDGDISLSLLPSPSLEVSKVRLANLTGGTAPEMVTLRSAVVNVALGPLIGGQIQVKSVRLNDPVINLEVMKDGSKNWEFEAPEDKAGTQAKAGSEKAGKAATDNAANLPVQVDAFRIANGTIIYRDQTSGMVERIDGLNAQIVAGSLIGPFDASGSFVRKALPLNFEVSVGKIIHGRTVGFASSLGLGSKGKAKISGTLVDVENGMRIKGDLKAEGANLADLLGALAGGGEYPGLLGQAFDASGGLTVSKDGLEIPDLMVSLGETKARVAANVTFGDTMGAGVAVAIKRVDLDDWLKREPIVTQGMVQGEQVAIIEKTDGGPRASVALTPKSEKRKPEKTGDKLVAIPKNISAAIDLTVEALSYSGGAISDAKVSLEIAGGEVTINQASAQLPGGSDVAAFGFIGLKNGKPKFEGSLEASVNDLRGVLRWLKIAPPPVAADRLRKLNVKSQVIATAEQLNLSETKLVLDSSTVTGGAAIALTKRPSFGATLTVDRLNLDSYLVANNNSPSAKAAPAKTAAPAKEAAEKTTSLPAALQDLKALTGFDANVKLLVKALTAQGAVANNARLDASLYQGNLTLKQLGADNLAGASIKVSGTLNKLGGVPEAKDLLINLSAQNTARLFELVKIASPISPKQLGAVHIEARADGSLLTPMIDASLKAMGGTFEVSGKLSPFDLLKGLKAQIAVKHGDLAGLMHALNIDYRPSGRNTSVSLSANAFSKDGAIALTNIDGSIAGSSMTGQIAVAESKGRKGVVAELSLGDFVFDPLMPGEPKVQQERRGGTSSGGAARSSGGGTSAPSERWSKDPLDVAALKTFDADVKIKAKSLTYGKYRVDNADAALVLANGVLTLSPLKGSVFGGQLDATGRLNVTAVPTFEGVLTLRGSDVRQGTRAVTGKDMASGTLSMSSRFSAAGQSVFGLVSNLNGEGDFALNRIDVSAQQASGTAIAGVLNLVKALNGLGGGKGKGLADVTGSYKMTNGIARSTNMKLVSGVATGGAQGLVDLPAWLTDVSGEVNMSQSALGIVLKLAKVKVPDRVPFTVKGPLDHPKVVLLKGQRSPGTTTGAPPDPRAPVENTQPQPKEKLKPEDIFKQLLKGGLR